MSIPTSEASAQGVKLASVEALPVDDVEACLARTDLQEQRHGEASTHDRDNMAWVRSKAIREGAPETVEWIWFTAPEHAWRSEAGTEGWLLYDRRAQTQHAYIETAMS